MWDWEPAAEEWLNQGLAHPFLDGPMVLVSLLGNMLPYALIALVLSRQRRHREAARFLLAILVAELAVIALKELIMRPRPDDARLLMFVTSTYSMPSGHAARAFAGFIALWTLGPRWRWTLGSFAVLTMLSRVYVGVHWPGDVLVGALVGLLCGFFAFVSIDALAFEMGLAQPSPDPGYTALRKGLREIWRRIRQADYLYLLRLRGGVTAHEAEQSNRLSRYWGAIRFFGPPIMVAAAWIVYLIVSPYYAGLTIPCLAGYFVPFGIEFGVPLCVGLGLPWWLVVLIIAYIDAWLALFVLLNFDYLHKLPRMGRWLTRVEERGAKIVHDKPWVARFQFVGVALVVFVPIVGTGIIPGILVGRMIGMKRGPVWLAVMTGTVVRISLFGLATTGVLRLVP